MRGGASEAEGRPWGVPDKQRARRMAENIEICRRLWSGEAASFAGDFRQFEDVTVQPQPIQNPCPIWIAANPIAQPQLMDRPLRRVAQKADGWMTAQIWPRSFGALWKRLSEILVEEGKDPATYPNRAYHNVNINDDPAVAYEESKRFLDLYYGPVFSEEMVRAWTALGTPDELYRESPRAAGRGREGDHRSLHRLGPGDPVPPLPRGSLPARVGAESTIADSAYIDFQALERGTFAA